MAHFGPPNPIKNLVNESTCSREDQYAASCPCCEMQELMPNLNEMKE